jgi:hypothetical protein
MRLPNPPITAAAKALMPRNPIEGSTSEVGDSSTPATVATIADSAQISELMRLTGMPM